MNDSEMSELTVEHYHAYLVLDGSGSMQNPEVSGVPKHRAVAKMVQDLINSFHDKPEITSARMTVICWDSTDVCEVRLADYDVKLDQWYKPTTLDVSDKWLDQWDPLINHGGATPTGRALAAASEMAQRWVETAMKTMTHRAVIYLMSDGGTYPETEPNGVEEKDKIAEFNAKNKDKGVIRLATVGYFQQPAGSDTDEDKARNDLKALPLNPRAYFEAKSAAEIAKYVTRTLTADK